MAPADKESGGLATLYVGDLHPDVTEPVLQEKFQSFGPIAMIHVCRDSMTRRSLGYAYVNFYNHADAQTALDKVNYTEIRGRCCRIMWNRKERQVLKNEDANIFVKNLDATVDSRTLFETFNMFGNITSCKVATDAAGQSRGYGFVQYESEDAAKQAIERVNGKEIAGKAIFVGPFIKRDRATAQKGGDGSLYVRNIPGDMDDAQVEGFFTPFGKLASSFVLNDGRSGTRYAFINFEDADSAKKAIEALHGKDLRSAEEKAKMESEDAARKEKAEAEKADAAADESKSPDGKEKEKGEKSEEADKDKDQENGDMADSRLPSYCLSVTTCKSKAERDMDSRRGPPRDFKQPEYVGIKLYVRNLPAETTDESLKKLFDEFGKVTDIKAVVDRDSGECKGYGFVRYATMEEATAAVNAMHLKEAIPGKPPLNVGLASGKGAENFKGKGKGEFKGFNKGKGKGKGFGGPGIQMPQGMVFPMQGMPQGMMQARPMFPGMPMAGMPPMFQGMPPMMMRPGMPVPRPGMPMPGMPMPAGAPVAGGPPLNAASLAAMAPQARKQLLGERMYQMIHRIEPSNAGKITGMFLEMDESELLILLESDAMLKDKVGEAMRVLNNTRQVQK